VALSIYDIQRLKETNYEKGIVETFIRNSDLMKVLPFQTTNTMQVQTRRMNSLPAVTWRARGQRFSDGGQPGWETVTDALYNLGAEINIDDADMKDKGPYIVNPVAFNTEAKVKAMIYDFHDKVINGDHATDPDSFEGIRVRIANLASGQTLYAASEVDIRPSAVTTTLALTFLNRIDEAKYTLDGNGGGNVICLTDADFIRSFKNCLRVTGAYVNDSGMPTSTLKNARETSNEPGPNAGNVFDWDGVRYIDMGVTADQTTKIVANETITNACRPAFFVKLGGNNFEIIQYGPLDVTEPRLLDDMVTYRGVVSWYVGAKHVHNKFGVKLAGSRVA
jgi:hypothetical protein